jgi:hypothetical protein
LHDSNFKEAENQLIKLENRILEFPEHIQAEIKDLGQFKRWQIVKLQEPGGMSDKENLTFLREMAKKGGIAGYQSQNILCFFFNECFDREIPLLVSKSPISFTPDSKETIEIPSVLEIRPNPANDWVMFEIIEGYDVENSQIDLVFTDVSGKTIHQTKLSRNSYLWETGDLDNGIYFIKVIINNEVNNVEKVVIQH